MISSRNYQYFCQTIQTDFGAFPEENVDKIGFKNRQNIVSVDFKGCTFKSFNKPENKNPNQTNTPCELPMRVTMRFNLWQKKHNYSYLVQTPTLRRTNSRMALFKVRIPTLRNLLRTLTLRRTILESYRRTYKQRTVLESFMCAKSEGFLL